MVRRRTLICRTKPRSLSWQKTDIFVTWRLILNWSRSLIDKSPWFWSSLNFFLFEMLFMVFQSSVIVVPIKKLLNWGILKQNACFLHFISFFIIPFIIRHFSVKVIDFIRNERSRDFSPIKSIPIKSIKPRMSFHFGRTIESKPCTGFSL